jgi:lipid A 3-O-deacylase
MRTTTIQRLAMAALLLAGCLPAHALDLVPHGISITGGPGERAPRMVGLGLMWDWDWRRISRESEVTAHTELLLNRWDIDPAAGHRHLFQYAVLPTLRMRLNQGASPFFIEVGVGLSWLDHEYRTRLERFGSRWNFYDVIGGGYTFGGPHGNNEVALRWTHTSNAGFVDPNPGQTFIVMRYTRRF